MVGYSCQLSSRSLEVSFSIVSHSQSPLVGQLLLRGRFATMFSQPKYCRMSSRERPQASPISRLSLQLNDPDVDSVCLQRTRQGCEHQEVGLCTACGLDPTKVNDFIIIPSQVSEQTRSLRFGFCAVSRQKYRTRSN